MPEYSITWEVIGNWNIVAETEEQAEDQVYAMLVHMFDSFGYDWTSMDDIQGYGEVTRYPTHDFNDPGRHSRRVLTEEEKAARRSGKLSRLRQKIEADNADSE